MEFYAYVIKQKDSKGVKIRKVKKDIISNNIVYKENLIEFTGWLLKLIRRFIKNIEYKINLEFNHISL